MPILRIDHRGAMDTVRSRLGDSLVRLHHDCDKAKQQERQSDDLFQQWQAQWSSRREQIARRLEMIEGHLRTLNTTESTSPQLAVIGPPDDAARMMSMASC